MREKKDSKRKRMWDKVKNDNRLGGKGRKREREIYQQPQSFFFAGSFLGETWERGGKFDIISASFNVVAAFSLDICPLFVWPGASFHLFPLDLFLFRSFSLCLCLSLYFFISLFLSFFLCLFAPFFLPLTFSLFVSFFLPFALSFSLFLLPSFPSSHPLTLPLSPPHNICVSFVDALLCRIRPCHHLKGKERGNQNNE